MAFSFWPKLMTARPFDSLASRRFVVGALASLLGAYSRQRAIISDVAEAGVAVTIVASSAAPDTVRRQIPPGVASRLDLLGGTASQFGVDEQASVWAVVIDVDSEDNGMAIAVVDDGTAILYTNANQPAAGHECHRNAAHQLCTAAAARLSMTVKTRDLRRPANNRVKFFFLTPDGPHVTEASIYAVDEASHPLHGLFVQAQRIFYEPRIVPEAPDARCSP